MHTLRPACGCASLSGWCDAREMFQKIHEKEWIIYGKRLAGCDVCTCAERDVCRTSGSLGFFPLLPLRVNSHARISACHVNDVTSCMYTFVCWLTNQTVPVVLLCYTCASAHNQYAVCAIRIHVSYNAIQPCENGNISTYLWTRF